MISLHLTDGSADGVGATRSEKVRLHGEAGDVNLIEAEKKMEEVRTTLKEKGYT